MDGIIFLGDVHYRTNLPGSNQILLGHGKGGSFHEQGLIIFLCFYFFILIKEMCDCTLREQIGMVFIFTQLISFTFDNYFHLWLSKKHFLPLYSAGTLCCDVVLFLHSITHITTIFYNRSPWVCTCCSALIPLGSWWVGILWMANTILAVLSSVWLLGPLELGISVCQALSLSL